MTACQAAASTMHQGKIAIVYLHLWMCLPTKLPNRFNHFHNSAPACRMIVIQPAAVSIEWKLANSRNQVSISNKLAAFAFFTEAQVLKLHNHRNGEAIVNGSIFNILRRNSSFLECRC